MRGEGGRGTERLAAEGDGVAPVGLVEPLRVGNAMLCIRERWATPSRRINGYRDRLLWRAGMRGEGGRGTERLAAEGDGVAPVGGPF